MATSADSLTLPTWPLSLCRSHEDHSLHALVWLEKSIGGNFSSDIGKEYDLDRWTLYEVPLDAWLAVWIQTLCDCCSGYASTSLEYRRSLPVSDPLRTGQYHIILEDARRNACINSDNYMRKSLPLPAVNDLNALRNYIRDGYIIGQLLIYQSLLMDFIQKDSRLCQQDVPWYQRLQNVMARLSIPPHTELPIIATPPQHRVKLPAQGDVATSRSYQSTASTSTGVPPNSFYGSFGGQNRDSSLVLCADEGEHRMKQKSN